MILEPATIAALLAGQPPCSSCRLPSTSWLPASREEGAAPSAEPPSEGDPGVVFFCDACAPKDAHPREIAAAVRTATAFRRDVEKHAKAGSKSVAGTAPVPQAPPARALAAAQLRQSIATTWGLSTVARERVRRASASGLSVVQQAVHGVTGAVDEHVVIPALAVATRLVARLDGGPVPASFDRAGLTALFFGKDPKTVPPWARDPRSKS